LIDEIDHRLEVSVLENLPAEKLAKIDEKNNTLGTGMIL